MTVETLCNAALTTAAKPILFLSPRSRTYERDARYFRLIFEGLPPYQAVRAVGTSPGAAAVVTCRVRAKATRWAGREVSDAMIFRLMFDRPRAEADLKAAQLPTTSP